MSDRCDLCEAAVITTRYYEDDTCWIADCEICLVPMVVWRRHDASPPEDVKARLHEALALIADRELGEGNWGIDDHMRNIPDHYHAHARPPYFWRRAQG
ncbi:MAG TPA: hypothetical protein VMV96_04405 [Acidimicrobiales bacterium]|nr:hypothetical protein [Acidimicrobiales bacterium]